MERDVALAVADQLLALADDELILGHRDSEWTGHAPILEEDIAFGNIALDELGHAQLWYRLLSTLVGQDPEAYPDRLVFQRDAKDWRNAQMVELPKGDWAFTIVRQYLFDSAELARLSALQESSWQALTEVAAKIQAEEFYHLRHSRAWLRRLGLGTNESHARMQAALTQLWPYALQMMQSLPSSSRLVEAGIVPDPMKLQTEWEGTVRKELSDCALHPPREFASITADRALHTEHLVDLLGEMQSVARLDPTAQW